MDARNHGVAQEVWPALLHAAFPELPQTLEAMLLALVLSGLRHRDVVSAESLADFLEYFAGQGELTCQCLRIGLQGFAMDVEYDGQHDVTTPAGLRLGLRLLWKIRQGGLVWLGTPCSSFVALCQSHARRYEDTCFLGDGRRDFVASGNLLMAISALLGLLAFWLDATPILEQPLTSVMPLAPPLSTVFAFVGARKVVTYHGAFGAPTLKPLQLWSPSGISGALRRDRPRVRPDQHLARRQGDSYTGDKEALHVSQAYTPAFGRAVAAMIQRHLSRLGAQ